MIATVDNSTPKAIEAATIILGRSSCASGRPKILPAMWSPPIVLPGKSAGNSPKKEKIMILTPEPMYVVA
jgi:hypothetical protein